MNKLTKFELDKYKDNFCMHCDTEEKAKTFLRFLYKCDRNWILGDSYLAKTNWETYKEDTCYEFNDGTYCSLDQSKQKKYTILEFDDFDWDEIRTGDNAMTDKRTIIKFFKKAQRLCQSHLKCSECELYNAGCRLDMRPIKRPEVTEEIVDIVEKWSTDHPVKTRQNKLLEQYPDFKIDTQGIVNLSPCIVEPSRFIRDNTSPCINTGMDCQECKREYWMEKIE